MFTKTVSLFSAAAVLFSMASIAAPIAQAAPPNDFKGVRIVIDPGHGGHDGGAIAPNGLSEKFINLSVSKYLAMYLRHGGATVKLTRSDDRFISLPGRAAIANNFKANRFVAIHQNSAPNRRANGTETYFHKPAAAKLSKNVQNELLKYLGHKNRGSRQAGFAVIRRTKMPGILTEASFISDPKEAAKLVSGTYRQRQALAIYRALQKDFGIKPKIAPVKKAALPVPAPVPAAPVQVAPVVKPLEPVKLQVQFSDKLGLVQNETVDSRVHLPYASGDDGLISIRNVGGEMAKPQVVFSDVLGNKVYEVQPFIDASSGFSFYPQNIVGKEFIGSIDIFEPIGQISTGLSAGVVAE